MPLGRGENDIKRKEKISGLEMKMCSTYIHKIMIEWIVSSIKERGIQKQEKQLMYLENF